MDAQRYRKLEALFQQIRDVPEPERAAAVADVSGDDAELAAELDALLAAASGAEDYFSALDERCAESVAGEGAAVLPVGTCIGAWRITRPLGAGGMAVVYEAERADGQFSMRAALKIVPVGLAANGARERFTREREILAGLDHPGLAHMVDGGVTGEGLPYFVMEYVDGVPIDQYCDQHRLIVNERLALVRQVLEVVQYAHRNLVVHRDLKPSNILVTEEGRVKLLDFGIAKVLDPARDTADPTELTQAAGIPMTPAWASPEQCRGEAITTASDVYTLGVLLSVLLAGRPPYSVTNGSPAAWRKAICEQPAIPPSLRVRQPLENEHQLAPRCVAARRGTTPERLSRRLKGDLDNILLVALRKEPERRYATVEQLAADLRRHAEGRPVEAIADSWQYRAGKFLRRHWVGAGAAALVALAVLAGLGGTFWQARVAEAESRQAQSAHEFVRTLLSIADPVQGIGFQLSPDQLLQRASDSIALEQLNDQSKVRVLLMMGQVYSRLSQFESAGSLLERAREVAEGTNGLDGRLWAELLLELSIVEYRVGGLETAAGYADASQSALEEIVGGGHPELAPVLIQQAMILQELGEYETALERLELSMSILEAPGVDEPALKANTITTIGYVKEKMTRFEEALADHLLSFEIASAHLPPDHLELAAIHNDLGRTYFWLGRYDQAAPHLQTGLDMRLAKLSRDDRYVSASHHNLGVTLYALGDAARAAEHLEEAVRGYTLTMGPEGWLTARGMWSLAMILNDLGQIERSEALFAAAREITETTYGLNHRDTIRLLMAYAYALNRRGQYTAAQSLAEDLLLRIDQLETHRDDFRPVTLSRLVASLAGQGKLEKALFVRDEICADEAEPLPEFVTAYTPACTYARIAIEQRPAASTRVLVNPIAD